MTTRRAHHVVKIGKNESSLSKDVHRISTFTFFFCLCDLGYGYHEIRNKSLSSSENEWGHHDLSDTLKRTKLLCVWQTFSIIFYFRECLLRWRCEDTTVRTTPRCAGSSRRGCTRTGCRRIGGIQPLKTSHWVTSYITYSSFWRRIMTGAAVKASAFQVLLLALLFVFTPSLFHLVLIEVFCFLNFLTP